MTYRQILCTLVAAYIVGTGTINICIHRSHHPLWKYADLESSQPKGKLGRKRHCLTPRPPTYKSGAASSVAKNVIFRDRKRNSESTLLSKHGVHKGTRYTFSLWPCRFRCNTIGRYSPYVELHEQRCLLELLNKLQHFLDFYAQDRNCLW